MEDDLTRIRPLGAGLTVFGLLQFVALARYPSAMAWEIPAAWLYILFLVAVVVSGAYTSWGPRPVARLRSRLRSEAGKGP